MEDLVIPPGHRLISITRERQEESDGWAYNCECSRSQGADSEEQAKNLWAKHVSQLLPPDA